MLLHYTEAEGGGRRHDRSRSGIILLLTQVCHQPRNPMESENHTPSDLVVNEGGADVGSSSTLDFLLLPTLSRVSSPDETSNNFSNINGLKFYHSIRWNLVLCHRGQ